MEVPVLCPIALVFPLSLAALASTPAADSRAPAAADEAAPPAIRVPDAAPDGDAKSRQASELDPGDPVEQDPARAPLAPAPGDPGRDPVDELPDGTLLNVQVPAGMPSGAGGAGAGTNGSPDSAAGAPAIRHAAPVVMASIDKDMIRRIIREHSPEIRACYDEGLARDPTLAGKLVLSFTVDRTGAVTRAEVAETTLRDTAVGTCLARAARRWRFPSGPAEFTVFYPFIFEPG